MSLTCNGMLASDWPSSRTSTEYRPASANFNCWMFTMKLRVTKCASVRQRNGHGDFHGRHDGAAVGVDEIERELVLALVAGGRK